MANSSKKARWSIIAITLVMNAALVVTSVAGFIGARASSRENAAAAATVLMQAVRQNFRHSSMEPQELLDSAVSEMKDQGLRYIGIFYGNWNQAHSAGIPLAEVKPLDRSDLRGQSVVSPLDKIWSVRIVTRVPACMGRENGRCWVSDLLRSQQRSRMILIVDVDSIAARETLSRAVTTLVVSLFAAAILLIAAVVMYRLSLRADRTAVQLAKDRHLKSLGQMSAVLGHELRNPIASLKGHAQLLLRKIDEDHPGASSAKTVVREAERLEVLTDQVLDFARTGKLDLANVDPMEIVHAAVERSEAQPVEIRDEGSKRTFELDAPRMEQVLVNLLYNARQSSEEGQPLELRVHRGPKVLRIEVTDMGEGIPSGDEEKIFEPFFTRKTRGTGLGLPLAKRIVEGHGGTIEAANRPEGGAVFRIQIPG